MNEPRDLVRRLEEKPPLPKDDGELLSGYGVMSCPLASGDILCSRRFPASSLGPAYTAGLFSVKLHLDALNRELVDRLQRGGETFVSNAVVGGHYVLRACIVNFHTTQTDVEAVPDIVARIGREVEAELRLKNSPPE